MPGESTLLDSVLFWGELSFDFRPLRAELQPGSAIPHREAGHGLEYRSWSPSIVPMHHLGLQITKQAL